MQKYEEYRLTRHLLLRTPKEGMCYRWIYLEFSRLEYRGILVSLDKDKRICLVFGRFCVQLNVLNNSEDFRSEVIHWWSLLDDLLYG